MSLKPGPSNLSSPAAFAPFLPFNAQFAECCMLLWVHTRLVGYWQKTSQQPPLGHAELHCGELMSCSALPYLLLHGPLCLLGTAEPPHGLFLVGLHFLFTQGGFRGRLTPPLLAQRVFRGCKGHRRDLTPFWDGVTHGRRKTHA